MPVYSSDDAMADFLTAHLNDPRGRLSTETLNKTGDGSTTDFSITPSTGVTRAVTEVREAGTAVDKWGDYLNDLRAQTVRFFSAPANNDSVDIDVKHGDTNWIFTDRPRIDLNASSYPRLAVLMSQSPGTRNGTDEAPMQYTIEFRVEAYATEADNTDDQIFTVDGRDYEGARLVKHMLQKVLRAVEDNEPELQPLLYNAVPTGGINDIRHDPERDVMRGNCTFSMKRLSIGESL